MSILHYPEKAGEIYTEFYKFGKKHKGTNFDLPDGPEERFGDKGTADLYNLNWLSLEDLETHEELLDSVQAKYLEAILNPGLHRRVSKSIGLPKINVLEGILGAVGNLKNYSKVIKCCTTGSAGSKPFKCDCRKYCDWCAGKKRAKHKNMYLNSWNPNAGINHFFLTVYIPDHLKTTNAATIIARWERLKTYIESLRKKKIVNGGLITEELSLNHLYPEVEVNPHVHILATSEHELESFNFEEIHVHVKPIENKKHWEKAISYLTKSYCFSETYVQEWTKENAKIVNKNFVEISQTFRVMLCGRAQAKSFGLMHPNNPNNIIDHDKMEYIAMERKKACKLNRKKIKCTQPMYTDFERGVKSALKVEELPKATTILLKTAYDTYGEDGLAQAPQESHWMRNLLGVGAAGVGAYMYGKNGNGGNNFLSGFSNGVDNNVINPLMNFADPYIRKISPSYTANQDRLWQQGMKPEIQGIAADKTIMSRRGSPSSLDGTDAEGAFGTSPFNQNVSRLANSTPVVAGMAAPLAPMAGGVFSSILNKFRPGAGAGLGKAMGSVGRVVNPIGTAAFAVNGLQDSSELGDAFADKMQLGDFGRGAAKGTAMAGGVGLLAGGARLGGKLLPFFGPYGRAAGGLIGAMAPGLINSFRRQKNNMEFNKDFSNNQTSTWYDAYKQSVAAKDAGNGSPLKAFYNSVNPEQLNAIKAKAENPFIAHQMDNLKNFLD